MVNDGLGRPGADDEERSLYLRGNKVCRRLAFKAPLVGRIYDLISLVRMQKAFVALPRVDWLEAPRNPSHAFPRLTETS